jgi:hypothetical protein
VPAAKADGAAPPGIAPAAGVTIEPVTADSSLRAPPPPPPLRVVPHFVRVALLVLFTAAATTGLFLFGMLAAGVRMSGEEQAMAMGFAVVSLILAGFSLLRSSATTFAEFWPFLIRPLLQIACVGSMVVSFAFLAMSRPGSGDLPPIIFFIVFPAVALLVLKFPFRNGGAMSQLSPTLSPHPVVAPAPGEFVLARVAGGAGRLVATAGATVLLIAAVFLAVAVVADVPALFNSDLVDNRLRTELRQTFGNADWPRLARVVGSVAGFVFGVVAVLTLVRVRKRSGVVHMLRVPAAAALLCAATVMLGRVLPAWSDLTPSANGWEVVDQYVQRVSGFATIGRAAVPFVLAMFVLLWPARRPADTPRVSAAATREVPR